MKLFRTVGLVCVASAAFAEIPTEDGDILEIAQRNPIEIYTSAGLAKYGDPDLAKAVDALADIPRPWTVPKIIAIFDKENGAWLRHLQLQEDMKSNQMWAGADAEAKRCEHLITLLAASREPRAAVVLANSIDNRSLSVRFGACQGLYHYFLTDPRYHQLPPEKPEPRAYTNFLPEMRRQVIAWWAINKDDLKRFSSDSDSPAFPK